MLSDRSRLVRQAAQPRYLRLARALKQLSSTVTVMNTGAHPDDEQTGLLAWLSLGEGMRVIIACSTRGEGGQNALGPERGAALGLVRSRELEEAARVINADVHWLGHGPVDPVHDFGFSKNGKDTLERWGRDRVIDRLVKAYRSERPDVVIPTFLDVPGQHGHHRAMTEAAEEALRLAADPSYDCEGLAPWSGIQYYLPAWSGGGVTYDDELPPPPATYVVQVSGREAASGMSYDRLGELSRTYHASQGMGDWRPEKLTSWGLHLRKGVEHQRLAGDIPATLAELAEVEGAPSTLKSAATAAAKAVEAFPNDVAMSAALTSALQALQEPGSAAFEAAHGHRLARKRAEVESCLALCHHIDLLAMLEEDALVPGQEAHLRLDAETPDAVITQVDLVGPEGIEIVARNPTSTGWRFTLAVAADLSPMSRYLPGFSSLGGNGLVSLRVSLRVKGTQIVLPVDLEEEVVLLPAQSISPSVDGILLNLAGDGAAQFSLEGGGNVSLGAVQGVTTRLEGTDVHLQATALGRGRLSLGVGQGQGWTARPISYGHIGRLAHVVPAGVDFLALELEVPQVRVAYIGGGADRAGLWLERMGADVTELDAAGFAAAKAQGFAGFDTIVIGIFSFGLRPDLAQSTADLRAWVASGGNLVTLYHRPWDNWLPDETPPARMVVGSPSLRWRVTRPDVPVTILEPEHPLMLGPNAITLADFEGWDKERGLYFLSSWDARYQPLLAMSDPDEQPLLGALVTGRIGEGRHTHTALVLHHQMDRLVPGAFRLMANLIAKP